MQAGSTGYQLLLTELPPGSLSVLSMDDIRPAEQSTSVLIRLQSMGRKQG